MATTYRIEQREGDTWTADGIGESRGWPTAADAYAAAKGLGRLGTEWAGLYRIVEERTGATVAVFDVEAQ